MQIDEVMFGAVYEISKLIKKSPKRDSLFQRPKVEIAEDTPGFRVLCDGLYVQLQYRVCWITMRYCLECGKSLKHLPLIVKAEPRVIGVETQMESFNFFFGLLLASVLLRHSDNLSTSLFAAEGQHLTKLTLDVLKSLHNDEQFTLFHETAIIYQNWLGVNPPPLPRKRRAPQRLEIGTSEGYHPPSVKDHYRLVYYEALDLVVEGITNCFNF